VQIASRVITMERSNLPDNYQR